MAYVEFASPDAIIPYFPARAPRREPVGLSGPERRAVLLAQSPRPVTLTDGRMDALRRFGTAVAGHRPFAVKRRRAELLSLRFTEAQIAEAASLASALARPASLTALFYAASAAIVVAFYLWVLSVLEHQGAAFVVTTVLALPVWAAAAPRQVARRRRARLTSY